jgi:hypothetical protein
MINAGSFMAIQVRMEPVHLLRRAHDRTLHAGDLRTGRALDASYRTRNVRIATTRVAGTSAGIGSDADADAGAGDPSG